MDRILRSGPEVGRIGHREEIGPRTRIFEEGRGIKRKKVWIGARR